MVIASARVVTYLDICKLTVLDTTRYLALVLPGVPNLGASNRKRLADDPVDSKEKTRRCDDIPFVYLNTISRV